MPFPECFGDADKESQTLDDEVCAVGIVAQEMRHPAPIPDKSHHAVSKVFS